MEKENWVVAASWKNINFVLTTPKPPSPTIESSVLQRDEYGQWKTSDDMAKCYIVATISDMLQKQHEGMGSAADCCWYDDVSRRDSYDW